MCAIFMDQSKVQRKKAVKGSPSLSDAIPLSETLGGLQWEGSCSTLVPWWETLSVFIVVPSLLEYC